MTAASRPTLQATGSPEAAPEPVTFTKGPDWRALGIEGLRALRAIAALAGQAPGAAEPAAPAAPAAGVQVRGLWLVLLIALVASPIACGAALITWGLHENRGAAAEAKAHQQRQAGAEREREREAARATAEEKRDAEQDAKIEGLERELMRMRWTVDLIAVAVGVKVAAKENDDG